MGVVLEDIIGNIKLFIYEIPISRDEKILSFDGGKKFYSKIWDSALENKKVYTGMPVDQI